MSADPAQPATNLRRLGSRRTYSTNVEPTGPEVSPTARETAPVEPASVPTPRSGPPPAASPAESRPTKPARSRKEVTRPRYDELERKEARLREDQVDDLNRIARKLAKQARRSRPAGTDAERITDNTLIRIAVDLLLARAETLAGSTEAELRKAVGL